MQRPSPLAASSLLLTAIALGAGGCRSAPSARAAAPASEPAAHADPQRILGTLRAVADWQLSNPSQHPGWDWTQATFWAGLADFAPLVDAPRYDEAIRRHGQFLGFILGPRPTHADDHAIAQSYFALFQRERDRRLIRPTLARFDELLRRPWDEPLEWKNSVHERELAWCDALFMSPPALARATTATGDVRYLELANRLWWKATDFLFDPEERLYFRDSRFFDKREPNGRKVFWSRGNGWVMGGLVRMLQELPTDHPDRPRYLALFRDLAASVADKQGADGYWRASLLDPASVPSPETSGTGFFVYGLAWGVNQGILDAARHGVAIERGWGALVRAVHPNGKLGHVQRIGDRPGATSADTTEVYGAGAMLLAGTEVYRRALLAAGRRLDVSARGGAGAVVELPLPAAEGAALEAGQARLAVVDGPTGAFLPHQAIGGAEGARPDRLLVQLDRAGGGAPGERRLTIVVVPASLPVPPVPARAFGRHVPERKDDFAWENDRVAFRVYGPALAAAGEVSSGVDVWGKRVRGPVIDAWYRRDDYHRDHGEGLDFYKVGQSRGCGGIGIWTGQGLAVSGNYASSKRHAAGPLRVDFELTYGPWGPPGQTVAERRRVTLDAGQNLSRFEVRLTPTAPGSRTLPIAIGVKLRPGDGAKLAEGPEGAGARWLAAWEAPQGEAGADGSIGCAVVVPGRAGRVVQHDGQALLVVDHPVDEPLVYYAGAAWSKGLDFPTADAWTTHVAAFAAALGGAKDPAASKAQSQPEARR